MDAEQAAYWINAGWDDFAVKGLSGPEYGRYSQKEKVLAEAGFSLAHMGFPRIETKD